MLRRDVIGKAASIAALAACTKNTSSTSTNSSRQKFNWRLVMAIPKTLPVWGDGVKAFAKDVFEMSRGDLDIKIYGAGELVPALGTFDAVKGGQVQMAHSASYYWQGKLPAAPFFTSVPFGMNANGIRSWIQAGGGQELWDELYAPHNVMSLPCGNTGLQMGGWFNKKINSIKDYEGLKMRIPGLGGKVIAKAGAKPMLVAGGEIYTNMATGVIDATEWVGPYHDFTMGFHKVAKYYYYPGWHEPGPVLELMINKNAWNQLPIDLQTIVKTAAAKADRDIYANWLAKDSEYLEKIKKETKVEILNFPDDVLQSMREFANETLAEVGATSPLAKKILESFLTFQSSYNQHQQLTEFAYAKAKNYHDPK